MTCILRTALAAAFIVALALPLAAIGPTPLPETALTTLEAGATTTAALPSSGHWLLLYVRDGCAACDTVLGAIDPDRRDEIAPRVVVVVAAQQMEEAKALADGHPTLRAATWYVDADGSFGRALAMKDAPVVMGVNGRTIQWSVAGVFTRGTRTRGLLSNWVSPLTP